MTEHPTYPTYPTIPDCPIKFSSNREVVFADGTTFKVGDTVRMPECANHTIGVVESISMIMNEAVGEIAVSIRIEDDDELGHVFLISVGNVH
jgi:hypothetical protein